MHPIRTTIYLSQSLHQRLRIVSQRKEKSVSDLVREAVDKAITEAEEAQLDSIYEAMAKMKGICKDPITDASTTIDEVLYGEKGAWRGSGE